MKTIRNFFLYFIPWILIVGIAYYIFLPAWNIHSIGMYVFLIIFCLAPAALLSLIAGTISKAQKQKTVFTRLFTGIAALCGILVAALVLLHWFNSTMFHAKSYASILSIQDYDFTEDIDEASALTKIALMDTDSARILGNREIGSLSEVVSQFEVARDYSQIDLGGLPYKVAALEYAGFFKYLSNKKNGIPGYVKIDPVAQSADYVTLQNGMIYVPSSYFQKDLTRHLRFSFPTKLFENIHFEVDEEGQPYYVASVIDYTIGLFGGKTVSGAIVCNPVTGKCTYYPTGEVPQWVDIVFDGDLLTQQYNWYGTLSGGFFNSIMAKKGCKKCTETVTLDDDDNYVSIPNYGYIAKDNDIWIYTGVTSVNKDSSNIGFLMVNERTAEAHFFTIAGADENSAMASAEGEVQEKGYNASFPSLINVNGNPTYIMVLKDANGLVKLYAMVNVEQYNIVATAATIDDCFSSYRRKLNGETNISKEPSEDSPSSDNSISEGNFPSYNEEDITEASFIITSIQYVDMEGNTYVYLIGNDGFIYKQKFADNEHLVLLKTGDSVRVQCISTGEGIYTILSLETT